MGSGTLVQAVGADRDGGTAGFGQVAGDVVIASGWMTIDFIGASKGVMKDVIRTTFLNAATISAASGSTSCPQRWD
jgi:hypothetical protein